MALSTYRAAARFCEEFDEFVFNHNESLLYEWVEQYEPELFETIQKLVKNRKWHIMGGWYLQPDCNMPSGESLIRQILRGKIYFRKKFGVEPNTAINLDPFGHTRGLVQILKKSGYRFYIICRPSSEELSLPADDFVWVGYDGSEVLVHRASEHYNSQTGEAKKRIEEWIKRNPGRKTGLLLWGIGNHGGGPSRQDLEQIRRLKEKKSGWQVRHSTPENYFNELERHDGELPRYAKDLNPWAVGCYTTMALVKQKHRQLESEYYLTEKMTTNAALQGLMDYPKTELYVALEDLLFCEFHDILPGSSILQVEAYALQRMDHGLEILSRLRTKAFFAFLDGQIEAEDGEFPIFVYNPHPHFFDETIICELQPQEPNLDPNTVLVPRVMESQGQVIQSQLEKESSRLSVDWRKRVVFRARLKPGQMICFSCRLDKTVKNPIRDEQVMLPMTFVSDTSRLVVNPETGFVDSYQVDGVELLEPHAFRPFIVEDCADSWGMKVRSFRRILGYYKAMSEEESAQFAGVTSQKLKPVRIIEDGPVRTIVEALFKYNRSFLCQRYKIPQIGSEFEVELRVFWNEKDKMLKLSLPTRFQNGRCRGQVAFGAEGFERVGEELVAQKWVSVVSHDGQKALTVINNGTYGFDFTGGELRLSLLRAPAYSADPGDEFKPPVPQDRFEPRIDQGERVFRFWINGGRAAERMAKIDREALTKNERPPVLCCFPSGRGKNPFPGVFLHDSAVHITAIKLAEENNWLLIRLFEPTGETRDSGVSIPCLNLSFGVFLEGFEIKTMAVDLDTREVFEVDLMERRKKGQD